MKPYPMELRERVMAAYDECHAPKKVAERFFVHVRWVHQLIKRRTETGSIAPLPPNGRHDHAKLRKNTCDLIAEWIREKNDLTLAEIQSRLKERGIAVTPTAIWYKLDERGLTYKKNASRSRTRSAGRPPATRNMDAAPRRNISRKPRVS